MQKQVRAILVALVMTPLAACTSWSDFVAQLQPRPTTDAASEEAPGPGAAEPMPTLARVYMKAGEKALQDGDTETARRFFRKAGELAPGLARRTPVASPAGPVAAAPVAAPPHRPVGFTRDDRPGGIAVATGGDRLDIRATELVKLYEQPADTANEATSLHRQAISHDFFGHYKLAQETYRKALALDPDNVVIRNNLALSLTLSGDYDEAVREMSHVTASRKATAENRRTLEMLLELAFQKDRELKRLQATRARWRAREGRHAAGVPTSLPDPDPAGLTAIAPSAGQPAGHTAPADGTHEAPDPVIWVARHLSSWWKDVRRNLSEGQESGQN